MHLLVLFLSFNRTLPELVHQIAHSIFRQISSGLAVLVTYSYADLLRDPWANLSTEVRPSDPSVRTRTAFTKVSEAATSLGLNDVTTNIANKRNALKSPINRFELTESPSLSRFLIHVFISVDFCES